MSRFQAMTADERMRVVDVFARLVESNCADDTFTVACYAAALDDLRVICGNDEAFVSAVSSHYLGPETVATLNGMCLSGECEACYRCLIDQADGAADRAIANAREALWQARAHRLHAAAPDRGMAAYWLTRAGDWRTDAARCREYCDRLGMHRRTAEVRVIEELLRPVGWVS